MPFDIDGNFIQIRPENIFESMIKFKQEHDNNFMASESAYLVNEMNYWNLTWRYYQQLKHTENFIVGQKITRIGNTSFDIESGLFNENNDKNPIANSKVTVVCFDFDNQNSVPVFKKIIEDSKL